MTQQSNTVTLAPETVQQHIETAQNDPTAPLWVGTDTDTNEPVTIDREQRFSPLLIIGNARTGKTTLGRHIASQQLGPDSGLCYVTGTDRSFEPIGQYEHRCNGITPDTHGNRTNSVLDEIGTDTALHCVRLGLDTGTGTSTATTLTTTLIEQLLQNRRANPSQQQPYTLVLDDMGRLDCAQLPLRQLLSEARQLRLHVVVTLQSFQQLPDAVSKRLQESMRTYITGQVTHHDARHLARDHPTATPDDVHALPRYQ